MSLSPWDYEMIRHAIARGPVVVERDGRRVNAHLMSWRPRHNGKHTKKARVQFDTGNYAHVPISKVWRPE